MPLFTINKKPLINDLKKENDKILMEEIKMQNSKDFVLNNKDYAIISCDSKKFYYILYCKNQEPFKYIQYTYAPDVDILENKILLEMFALKVLLKQLKLLGKNSIIIYSNIKDYQMILTYSKIENSGSMLRYKANEIIEILNDYPIEITYESAKQEVL